MRAEPDPPKQQFFAFLWYPSTVLRTAYRKQFYPKPMESRDSEGVPFASLGGLWPRIWQLLPDLSFGPEGCRKVVTWPSRKLKIYIIDTRIEIQWFQKCHCFRSTTKNNEVIAKKKHFRTVASPSTCERLAVLNWRSLSIHPSSYFCYKSSWRNLTSKS